MTLEAFDDYVRLLKFHDWYYDDSDDHMVWTKGNRYEKSLEARAKSNPFMGRALAIWKRYVHNTDRGKEAIAARDAAINEIRTELLITA